MRDIKIANAQDFMSGNISSKPTVLQIYFAATDALLSKRSCVQVRNCISEPAPSNMQDGGTTLEV